jgi:CMP-N-acetylneuraminic acid synthetase
VTGLTAIVPMRGGSVRVPGKNVRLVAGKPLFWHVVDALQRAKCVERIVVDSDSPDILARVEESFPGVQRLLRPAHLGTGSTPMNAVIANVLAQVPGEWFLQTHSTNPFLRPETIDAAWASLQAAPQADSLFSVTPLKKRFWSPEGKAINHDPSVLLPTQDLPETMEENSCLYVFARESFVARRNRIGARPLLFRMDPLEAVDIDTPDDWALADALMRARRPA